ncbi:MAG: acetyl-CoA decarbonylase/synthase complex subunit gamma [Spirochaetaceae bacterium]|nr:acetyl-CoA decarbonylase/synthase complex subunit gamma [Spirochaetaceae bacterium]
MALSGLDIQKLLPKTNCKECGSNTCLAFAMKLAGKKASLSECPYASEEAKRVLGAASEPPVKALSFGPDGALRLGGETVLYRHEKTFVHPSLIAIDLSDADPPERAGSALAAIRDYELVRVGMSLRVDMVSVTQRGSDAEAFAAFAKKAYETAGKPLLLRSADPAALIRAAEAVKGSGSVLVAAEDTAAEDTAAEDTAAGPSAADALRAAAEANGHSLAVTGDSLDEVGALSARLKASGFDRLVLQFRTRSLAETFQTDSIARRMAIKEGYKSLGYPHVRYVEPGSLPDETAEAVIEICKYGGIVALPRFDAAQLAALMTLRLNIYTDPQKPIQVEPKVYAIGEPDERSPVFVTTNFSLTYFIVSGEIENSGASAWLLIPECEGMSVLTAWAAGKFGGQTVAKALKESGLFESNSSRTLVIPGFVSQISGEIEESLPGWKVLVGPQDAGDIESFVKARLAP